MIQLFIASDHAGVKLKALCSEMLSNEFAVTDLGPFDETSVDYPDFAKQVCKNILSKKDSLGILICGSGQGMAMTANRFKGIRAALCWDEKSAELSKQHNNANVLCLASRLIENDLNLKILKKWLSTSFEGGRHQNRVNKIEP
ncbi:MAG: ribose 5-phosphate isomerase B [Oligoflexia bacterium]|nr:ribose 5-phosphate isomerase B [Oligoflexia bacterium]